MSIARQNVEAVLVKRVGSLLTAVSLDGTTVSGSNADLNDPIGYALRKLGHPVASIAAVTTAEVGALGTDEVDEFLDLAELRVLETCHSHALDLVTLTVGPRQEVLSDLAKGLEAKIGRLRKQLQAEYGLGLGELEGGTIHLDFSEETED